MSRIAKIAESDAFKWARAEMFFGEGAGTRRKLLSAEIAHKVESISGYHEAFEKAYGKQDFAAHAIAAAKERKRLDRSNVIGRNVRGIVTGNRRQLTGTVGAALGLWWFACETGLDEPIKAEAKKRYAQAKVHAKQLHVRLQSGV